MAADSPSKNGAEVTAERQTRGVVRLRFRGDWRLKDRRPATAGVEALLGSAGEALRITFDTAELGEWDSALIVYLARVVTLCRERGIEVDERGLPAGAQRLLKLAFAVPPREGRRGGPPSRLARIGEAALAVWRAVPETLAFVGEVTRAFGRLLTGRARYRRADLLLAIQEAGPGALPIVSLISFLVGVIVAYMGAVQLAQFGAQIYIADLVAIGMVREMGGLMAAVIMAGRTGAAFAAQLGTMRVNEEIDAFQAMGIPPVEFLVLPRMVALMVTMPLLTLYAGVVGILAGLAVAVLVFDIGVFEYYHETVRALDLRQFAVGVGKGAVYGGLIALAGCLRGMQCGRSAEAVGQATTSAVVTGIVLIVLAASLLTIVLQRVGV
ncbi:ABC transporter permease [Endothiovibrio diazotrophicus]